MRAVSHVAGVGEHLHCPGHRDDAGLPLRREGGWGAAARGGTCRTRSRSAHAAINGVIAVRWIPEGQTSSYSQTTWVGLVTVRDCLPI